MNQLTVQVKPQRKSCISLHLRLLDVIGSMSSVWWVMGKKSRTSYEIVGQTLLAITKRRRNLGRTVDYTLHRNLYCMGRTTTIAATPLRSSYGPLKRRITWTQPRSKTHISNWHPSVFSPVHKGPVLSSRRLLTDSLRKPSLVLVYSRCPGLPCNIYVTGPVTCMCV